MGRKLTHEEFIERLLVKNKHYINGDFFLNEKYKGQKKKISCHCNIHNCDWTPFASALLLGCGCPYCAGKLVFVGETDLWTTRPDIATLLKNKEDGYKYSSGSGEKVSFMCPRCGYIDSKQITTVCRQGYSCSRCSDGISYPNKFARALIDQLPVNYHKSEWQPDWAKPYFYDNYFEFNGDEYILEMDGSFHYKENSFSGTSLKEVEAVDRIKDELAKNHNIRVIRIECLKSNCDYIKNNIINSELDNIFDLKDVDWIECDKMAQKTLVKEVCDLYTSGVCDFCQIGSILHISSVTVQKYIKRGARIGWCNYDPTKSLKEVSDKRVKIIYLVDEYNNIIQEFYGTRDGVKKMKILYDVITCRKSIKNACIEHKPYKGFNFRYANETIQN